MKYELPPEGGSWNTLRGNGSQCRCAESGACSGCAVDAGNDGRIGIEPARVDLLPAGRTPSPRPVIDSLKSAIDLLEAFESDLRNTRLNCLQLISECAGGRSDLMRIERWLG